MKEKEFNLSDKIRGILAFPKSKKGILIEDIKEFIKRLKDVVYGLVFDAQRRKPISFEEVDRRIDTLAGDDLK